MPAPTPTSTTGEIKQRMIERFRTLNGHVPRDTIGDAVSGFKRDALHALLEMRDALARREGERLRLAACTMQGSCSDMGLSQLAALCGQIERLALEDAFAAAALELRRVAAEYRQVQTALDELVAGEQAPPFSGCAS